MPLVDCRFGGAENGADLWDTGSIILRNSRLDSTVKVAGTAAALSQRHNQVPGLSCIIGNYVHSVGTLQWNYSDASYPGAGDAAIRKEVQISGTFTSNAGGGGLEMVGHTVSTTVITRTLYAAGYYGFEVRDGDLKACLYKFFYLDRNGFCITGTTSILATTYGTGLEYGYFRDTEPESSSVHLKYCIPVAGVRVITGCAFVEDLAHKPTYDVWVDIGAGNVLSMTQYWIGNYTAGEKDAELGMTPGTSGEVQWAGTMVRSATWTTQNDFLNNGASNTNYDGPTVRTDTVVTDSGGGAVRLGYGYSWLAKSPAVTPTARYGYGLAYDAKRDKTVLFGGFDSGGSRLDKTWEWSGTDWVQVAGTLTQGGPGLSRNGL